MMDTEKLTELVRPIVEERLSGWNVVDLKIERGIGWQDDEILNVTIVMETDAELDPKRTVSMLSRIRDTLLDAGEPAFPIITYMTAKDFGSQTVATAIA